MTGPFAAAGGGRNYGYGRDLGYAGRQALSEYYGGGHYATVATHGERFGEFAQWAKEEAGIRDLTRNDAQDLIKRYAEHVGERVRQRELSVSYGQNLISSAQVTVRAMTGDTTLRVSPSEYVGARISVRTEAPGAIDRDRVDAAAETMRSAGVERAAAVIELAREFGMREREASLGNLDRLYREAQKLGAVNIQEGTKGGRNADRWVPVSERGREVLVRALAARPDGSRNLVDRSETWARFRDSELRSGREHLRGAGIKGYHDARAAYACHRYEQLTGRAAPAVSGQRPTDRAADLAARQQISYELGHGRADVVASYVGGRS